jgi:N-acetylmuramoyl-L-alanine amidase/AmpD protein
MPLFDSEKLASEGTGEEPVKSVSSESGAADGKVFSATGANPGDTESSESPLISAPLKPLITEPQQAVAHDVFPGDPFPTPWVDPGFKKLVWITSPNFGRRPDNAVVDTIVIHATVIPTLELTAHAFYRKSSQVSSHFVIGKDGSMVQCVSTFSRAWHAGKSRDFRGYDDLNNFSVGIELVNLDDGKDPYPKAQIEALKALIRVLKRRFPLTQITSHEYIALPYGRKNDPAGFPWKSLDDLGLNVTHEGHAPLVSTPIPVPASAN